MSAKLTGATLALISMFACSAIAAPWAAVGGYYPGIEQSKQKKVNSFNSN